MSDRYDKELLGKVLDLTPAAQFHFASLVAENVGYALEPAHRNREMSITVKEPFDLRATLATMKSAKEKRVAMAIWDRDIRAVEEAIGLIEQFRSLNRIGIEK